MTPDASRCEAAARRVLVTGAAGFVGANLARRLLKDGHEVHLVVRPGGDRWRIASLASHARIHACDLADPAQADDLLASVRPEWAFHLAAHGAYPFQTDALQIHRSNCLGTANLVSACLAASCQRIVNVGSSSEYGFKDHAPGEEEALEPAGTYAAAKAAATLYCSRAARAHGLPIPTLRLYSAYGPFEEPSRLVPTLLRAALQGRLPPLAAPATARDFIFVEDACEAILGLAVRPPADPGAIFNLGSGVQTSLAEMVALVRELFEVRAQPEWGTLPARRWDTSSWVSDCRKLRSHLGWGPRVGLADGLLSTARWMGLRAGAEAMA
jgi:UDP-glucose 4-epimerase